MQDTLTFFKTLADETRLNIALLLTFEPICVCDLMSALNESQPKVSRHLALMRENNILMSERRGQWVYYQIHTDLPEWACEVLRVTAANHKDKLEEMLKDVHECQKANPDRCN